MKMALAHALGHSEAPSVNSRIARETVEHLAKVHVTPALGSVCVKIQHGGMNVNTCHVLLTAMDLVASATGMMASASARWGTLVLHVNKPSAATPRSRFILMQRIGGLSGTNLGG